MTTRLQDARTLDAQDPLRSYRSQFHMPLPRHGQSMVYLCGNSLGLQPTALASEMHEELMQWQTLGVEGHTQGRHPWLPYHELLREPLARLTGAEPAEVVAMNTLTVNLHLMMVSFYRPDAARFQVVMEKQSFPSDRYAVESQIRFHGFDPDQALIELEDAPGTGVLSAETLAAYLETHGQQVALVLMPGVQYYSGQVLPMADMAELAHRHGALFGLDLAHAIGNVPLQLHDWQVDFAVWCSYKYLNSGPGAVAGCFVHARHCQDRGEQLPRFNGWWGHQQEGRFRMAPEFRPAEGADAWQLSNPPILALAPVRVSLALFDQAGLTALREKSIRMTGFLAGHLRDAQAQQVEILTPDSVAQRGCQLSLRLRHGAQRARAVFDRLTRMDVICDWREPDVIRIAPVPLYNSYEDCALFVDRLGEAIADVG